MNGTLTFCGCPKVVVESVELKCAAGVQRAASCINVRDAAQYNRDDETTNDPIKPIASVRINNCELHAGHRQVEILLINIFRSHVENNIIRVSRKPRSLSLSAQLQNKMYRSAVCGLMIHSARLGESGDNAVHRVNDTVSATAGNGTVRFKTYPSLVNAWNNWIKNHRPEGVQNNRDLLRHLKKIAGKVLLNKGVLTMNGREFVGFRNWYNELNDVSSAAGSQGIVIGGSIARHINILNNMVRGFWQGIHIGVSHSPATSKSYDMAGTVQISGNNIRVLLSPRAQERYGIFIGNCDSLIVQNNYAYVHRYSVTSKVTIDGIRTYGHLGRMMIIRQNNLVNTTVGIRVVPLNVSGRAKQQWIVTDNIAPNSVNAVRAPKQVRGIADNYA